jgi:hypothetical protein
MQCIVGERSRVVEKRWQWCNGSGECRDWDARPALVMMWWTVVRVVRQPASAFRQLGNGCSQRCVERDPTDTGAAQQVG